MNSRNWHYTLALILVLLAPSLVFAEKLYISDTLIVSLRDSANLRGDIVSYVRSGDLLEVIKERDDGFILVQTTGGERGWIQKKYTINERPKALIIADLEVRIKTLRGQLESAAASKASLKAAIQTSKTVIGDRGKEVARLQETINELKGAVRTAENSYEDLRQKSQGVEEVFSERDNLLARLKTVDQEVALLRVENAELIKADRILWFLAGFGVFLMGWIMGKAFKRTKRSSLSM